MPISPDTQLTRFFNAGEQEVSINQPFIVNRFSPNVVGGTNNYVLPDNIISIRRVAWCGIKVEAMSQRTQREVFQGYSSQGGRPYWYIYNNVGINQIQLFPTPQTSLMGGTTDLWGSDIPTSLIIEYWQVSDNNLQILPAFIRRQLLKVYVAMRYFSIEGSSQNLALAKYYAAKWTQKQQEFGDLMNDLHNLPRKLILNNITLNSFYPGTPMLPIDKFGVSVDDGY